ncbi:MAG: hypothetical protein M1820_000917 [Bogoriella megaspora]|nr:MAG: hypothetical protein M1820_000917 [Bogoriella megaspora]
MPVSFGSVGDIISVSLLIKDLVVALSDSKGSVKEYEEAVRELQSLDKALLEVEALAHTHAETPAVQGLCETAKQAAERCKIAVKDFTAKTENTLANSQHAELCAKISVDESQSYRARNLPNLMLENIQSTLRSTELKKERMSHLITSPATSISRPNWVEQPSQGVRLLMQGTINAKVAMCKAEVSIQDVLLRKVPNSMIEEPFLLEDAIGRVAPVPSTLVTSWPALQGVLEARFQDVQGAAKISAGSGRDLSFRVNMRILEVNEPSYPLTSPEDSHLSVPNTIGSKCKAEDDDVGSLKRVRLISRPQNRNEESVTSPDYTSPSPSLTYSKSGVLLDGTTGSRREKHYPPSWGCSADKMKMKKRVSCVYDGASRTLERRHGA